jgi:DNA transformation protein
MTDERWRPSEELAAHFADVLAPLGRVGIRRFFGGHSLQVGGTQFAMLLEGTLYLRADAPLAAELESLGASAFSYRTKRREVRVASYWSVPEAELDDEEALVGWARRALGVAGQQLKRRPSPTRARAARGKRARPSQVTP